MSNNDSLIIPGVGFGAIKFGISIKEVEDILGKPECFENLDEAGDIIYDYEIKGINILFFDNEEDFRLINIELNRNSNAVLWKLILFDLTIDEIEDLCKKNGYSLVYKDSVEDCDSEEYLEIAYSVKALRIYFYFSNSKQLSEINFGVIFNENDEIIWPD
jgi:hypothetical protein